MKLSDPKQFLILAVLFSTVMAQLPGLEMRAVSAPPQPASVVSADFKWARFLYAGDSINFTSNIFGGTPPFTFDWDFGDGQTSNGNTIPSVLHVYSIAGNLTVALTITDSTTPTSKTVTVTKNVVVLYWPTSWNGWSIRTNSTATDGINLSNITFRGNLVVRDARLTGINVVYKDKVCFFYDELEDNPGHRYFDQGFFEYSTNSSNPYLQIRAKYIVPGYYYQQVWRFYPGGRWDAELLTGSGGGCGADHVYDVHYRFDLAMVDDPGDFMGTYTSTGFWRNLVWEGNHTDNGLRDQSHNGTQWRFGGDWKYYYMVPFQTRDVTHRDLPEIAPRIYLVRAKASEIEATRFPGENPYQFVNPGELAFNTNIAFWFINDFWVHNPVPVGPVNVTKLAFYPSGL